MGRKRSGRQTVPGFANSGFSNGEESGRVLTKIFSKSEFALTLPIRRTQRIAEYKPGTLFKGEGRWIWRLRNGVKKLGIWHNDVNRADGIV